NKRRQEKTEKHSQRKRNQNDSGKIKRRDCYDSGRQSEKLRDLRGGTTISQWGTLRLRRTNHQNYSVRCFPRGLQPRVVSCHCLLYRLDKANNPASPYSIIALLVSGELRLPVFTPRLRHSALPARSAICLSFAVRLG